MVYLDNNSTTPMDERVKKVYCDTTKYFGIGILILIK